MQKPTSELHAVLLETAKTYCESAYRAGKVLYSVTQGDNEGHQLIELSCMNVKLDSFWAGEWQSTWTVNNGVLSGTLMIRAHYFEKGNMQFNLDKTFDSINVQNIASAKDIFSAIKKVEDKVSKRKLEYMCLEK